MTRYVNPYTNFGFRKLFGEEGNKDLLIDFLNSVLPQEYQAVSLCFNNNPEKLPNHDINKTILDITCTDKNNKSFTVELQQAGYIFYKDRALFEKAYPIQRQVQKNDWDFEHNPIFLIAVLGFDYSVDEERRKLQKLMMLNENSSNSFLDKLQMIFLQLPCFELTESELATRRDQWLFFLKNLEYFEDIPEVFCEPIFEKALHSAEFVTYPQELQDFYFRARMCYWDNKNAIDTAYQEGYVKGLAIVKAKAEIMKIAKDLERSGLDKDAITKMTEYSIKEIEQLQYIG